MELRSSTFTITQESQSLQFKGYGFKHHVPEGSLPAGVSETKLKVQASLSGQFQMPHDCELLSAVYWVYSPHKFTNPLTFEVILCSDQRCSELSFISSKRTQQELPYVFKLWDGGVFSPHSLYGGLALTQFSGFGIAANGNCSWKVVLQKFKKIMSLHKSTHVGWRYWCFHKSRLNTCRANILSL